jgi:uncharacterized protein involved in response to NO
MAMPEGNARTQAPFDHFRIAFFLAALTAIRAIAFPSDIWQGDYSRHASELIFGFMLVQLFGFMLKALPRWVGRPILAQPLIRMFLFAQAVAFLLGIYDLALGAQLRSAIGLAAVAAFSVTAIRARAIMAFPLLALAAAHAGTGIVAALDLWPGATMLGFCLILAICFEVGNRIFPMVIDSGRTRAGRPSLPLPAGWICLTQRVSSLLTLLLWAFDLPYALAAALAGISGMAWLILLAPWHAFQYGGVRFMSFAMLSKRAGFLLLAIQAWPGSAMPLAVPQHVLAIGGLASLAVAIATSMVRKRNGQSFQRSFLGTATYLCLVGALALRVGYALYPAYGPDLLYGAQGFWLAGYGGYAVLTLRRRNTPNCSH